jgi:hypothetical protein
MRELAGFVFILICLTAFVFYIRWIGNDAYHRGKSPYIVLFVVLFFFPVGLLGWLLFRPPLLHEARGGPQWVRPTR